MEKLEVEMTYKKSTKGTHVYSNENTDTAIPSLYIKRDAMPVNQPASIAVTIEVKE